MARRSCYAPNNVELTAVAKRISTSSGCSKIGEPPGLELGAAWGLLATLGRCTKLFQVFVPVDQLLLIVTAKNSMMAGSWETISCTVQKSLFEAIPGKWRLPAPLNPSLTDVRSVPRTCGLLTPRQLEITEQTASELLPQLREAKLSSAEVTEAFCARAAVAHQCVCLPSRLTCI